MNIWKHSLSSASRFGGEPEDYLAIHAFIDHSKLYTYHFKHRLLLHNLYGVELCMEKFGEVLQNSEGHEVVVRDIAVEHCKEDLSGRIPTLRDWLRSDEELLKPHFEIPSFENETLEEFVLRPYLRSGLHASLMITMSDFGVGLVAQFVGSREAIEFRKTLSPDSAVKKYLSAISFTDSWMYTPDLPLSDSLNTPSNTE